MLFWTTQIPLSKNPQFPASETVGCWQLTDELLPGIAPRQREMPCPSHASSLERAYVITGWCVVQSPSLLASISATLREFPRSNGPQWIGWGLYCNCIAFKLPWPHAAPFTPDRYPQSTSGMQIPDLSLFPKQHNLQWGFWSWITCHWLAARTPIPGVRWSASSPWHTVWVQIINFT